MSTVPLMVRVTYDRELPSKSNITIDVMDYQGRMHRERFDFSDVGNMAFEPERHFERVMDALKRETLIHLCKEGAI